MTLDQKSFFDVRELSIRFPVRQSVLGADANRLGGEIQSAAGHQFVSALDNVSFRLEAGDTLGLLGHNGSGKTTLLRAMAGIFPPTSGEVKYQGKLGNAININIGFRPEVSGRNNIKLKAIIAGKMRSEFEQLVEDVETFARLGPYLDMPMRTYSHGMRARLAFGVATAFHYDILLLDEWLGAGDKEMQKSASERMKQFVEQANIIILATHHTSLMRRWCNMGLVLQKGRMVFIGPIGEAIEAYNEAYSLEDSP
ncbi:ABC-type polysaccharide/polyol phosphate transport system, ATPase component (plasmid) [Hoeflea sp. IMCC20628]|uniref:ABC transporter ATP-binding protein n=1 Tax=Hoeflea sp. IMCC20628 TaxID=1620421 RepID=UPI00063BE2E6|nr:ATP-binding cassette domain-containing protein [Hoeflea sp. IMCC20628]AKI03393.1 ABC-type polysaccharide/polyol phosphate transport system, ATPase component [Hoeflea sp. IMCC20628]